MPMATSWGGARSPGAAAGATAASVVADGRVIEEAEVEVV